MSFYDFPPFLKVTKVIKQPWGIKIWPNGTKNILMLHNLTLWGGFFPSYQEWQERVGFGRQSVHRQQATMFSLWWAGDIKKKKKTSLLRLSAQTLPQAFTRIRSLFWKRGTVWCVEIFCVHRTNWIGSSRSLWRFCIISDFNNNKKTKADSLNALRERRFSLINSHRSQRVTRVRYLFFSLLCKSRQVTLAGKYY